MSAPGSFYVTTPIFYVNDVPHIGHAYTVVAADVVSRWHRQSGDLTWSLTGTDEHGQKILRSATAAGVNPQEWVDRLVDSAWRPMLQTVNAANDDFIRTTEPRHERNVQAFLQHLFDEGHIYEGEFTGSYCVGCEEYKQPSDLVDGDGEFLGAKVCAIHSKPVETLNETNYFFRMSAFTDRLLELYEQHPAFIQPESARNEVIQFVKQGLLDLSISRSTIDWGVRVPWDESHVVYVWFDALLNYVTAIGYGQDEQRFQQHWPGYHIVGKDILRFHAVIWPAMLMAAGLDVPKGVFGHGWLLVGGEKMSKSKLTGIAPETIVDKFGSDAFRYYFMRAITFGQDGSFSWEDLHARYTAELANGFGNLASRTIAMLEKYFDGVVPQVTNATDSELALTELEREVTQRADAAMERFALGEALTEAWRLVDALNGYITEQEPWALAKDEANRDRLATVLASVYHGLGTVTVLLAPTIPIATQTLWRALGSATPLAAVSPRAAHDWPAGSKVSALSPLFPRVEDE